MSVRVTNHSRLLAADLREIDGVVFWDTVELPDFVPGDDDIPYVVESGDRIDLLADRFYQEPRLWWAIAWANDMENFPTDLKEGETIRIPSKTVVERTLAGYSRAS